MKNKTRRRLLSGVAAAILVLSFSLMIVSVKSKIVEKSMLKEVSIRSEVKKIQTDCINAAQNVSWEFDLDSTYPNPIFYQEYNVSSFNRNQNIINAIISYRECLQNDVRYSKLNSEILEDLREKSLEASLKITEHMNKVIMKNQKICEDIGMSRYSKIMCMAIRKNPESFISQ